MGGTHGRERRKDTRYSAVEYHLSLEPDHAVRPNAQDPLGAERIGY